MKRITLALVPIFFAVLAFGPSVLAYGQAKPADVAYNNGYQAGYKLGQADKKVSGEKPDYMQASAYRRATDGWKEGTGGDLEAYRASYRNGFTDGYRDGLGEPIPAKPAAPKPAAMPPAQPPPPPQEE